MRYIRYHSRKRRKVKKRTRGGYQYLSNVGFSNGYQTNFDNTMSSPSAVRISDNWVLPRN